ncbi:MAG TPA: 2Fe-2S iron-sulfur cluster-binding protein [Thermoanaerobaculia bacterium]|nr:2Fe-2S iron-sulfur cluster-binding protein [Thermoanaerobaculia bacterium]
MPGVCFLELGRVIEWPTDLPLLRCALHAGIEISHVCDGDGACGTCRIEVIEGWDRLTPQTHDELSREMTAPYRLSCQTRALGDIVVRVAKIEE